VPAFIHFAKSYILVLQCMGQSVRQNGFLAVGGTQFSMEIVFVSSS